MPDARPIDALDVAAAVRLGEQFGGGTTALAHVARELLRFAREVERLRGAEADRDDARRLALGLADRVAAQSELLARRAEAAAHASGPDPGRGALMQYGE